MGITLNNYLSSLLNVHETQAKGNSQKNGFLWVYVKSQNKIVYCSENSLIKGDQRIEKILKTMIKQLKGFKLKQITLEEQSKLKLLSEKVVEQVRVHGQKKTKHSGLRGLIYKVYRWFIELFMGNAEALSKEVSIQISKLSSLPLQEISSNASRVPTKATEKTEHPNPKKLGLGTKRNTSATKSNLDDTGNSTSSKAQRVSFNRDLQSLADILKSDTKQEVEQGNSVREHINNWKLFIQTLKKKDVQKVSISGNDVNAVFFDIKYDGSFRPLSHKEEQGLRIGFCFLPKTDDKRYSEKFQSKNLDVFKWDPDTKEAKPLEWMDYDQGEQWAIEDVLQEVDAQLGNYLKSAS